MKEYNNKDKHERERERGELNVINKNNMNIITGAITLIGPCSSSARWEEIIQYPAITADVWFPTRKKKKYSVNHLKLRFTMCTRPEVNPWITETKSEW